MYRKNKAKYGSCDLEVCLQYVESARNTSQASRDVKTLRDCFLVALAARIAVLLAFLNYLPENISLKDRKINWTDIQIYPELLSETGNDIFADVTEQLLDAPIEAIRSYIHDQWDRIQSKHSDFLTDDDQEACFSLMIDEAQAGLSIPGQHSRTALSELYDGFMDTGIFVFAVVSGTGSSVLSTQDSLRQSCTRTDSKTVVERIGGVFRDKKVHKEYIMRCLDGRWNVDGKVPEESVRLLLCSMATWFKGRSVAHRFQFLKLMLKLTIRVALSGLHPSSSS